MNYRTYENLIKACDDLCARIDPPMQIYGIPRSGILLATMMSLKWNVPLRYVGSITVDDKLYTSRRMSDSKTGVTLLVDDSVRTGKSMFESSLIVQAITKEKPKTVCAYVTPELQSSVDYYHEIISVPRIWEWNIFHHSLLSSAGCDIDNVVCPDPKIDEQIDPLGYIHEITTAPCLRHITYKVGAFVTNRLEIHRNTTEEWLKRNGFKYDKLIMSKHSSVVSRRSSRDYALNKSRAIRDYNLKIFIESSSDQAKDICLFSRVPVLCTDTNVMHSPITTLETKRKNILNM